jgi:hypothetical protein
MSTDPLLKAIARGDANCPDGVNLARLGALTRAAGAVPGRQRDLRASVARALDATDGREDEDSVARWVDGGADPALDRLRGVLAHGGSPRRVDLRDRVRRALAPASLRMTPQQAERTGRRWRLVAAIAAAHVAAILLFTTLSDRRDPSGNGPAAPRAASNQTTSALQAPSWERLYQQGGDLLAPRRSELARETARAEARLGDTAPAVGRLVAWLIAHQDERSGRISAGSGIDGDRMIAAQALAALALLGEGAGDQTRLARARLALGPVAAAMAGAEPIGPAALSAAALALVEGALVTRDPELELTARAGLLRLTRELPGRPHEGGLAGLGWLAIEAAAAGGLETPRGALEAARNRIAKPLPHLAADQGRLGLAAYARQTLGLGTQVSARDQVKALASQPPALDAAGRADPLAWFLSGLAVHAEGGPAWGTWAAGLSSALLPVLANEGAGLARLPAERMRYADGDDVLATAAAILALQVPYRYAVPSRTVSP